MIVEVKVPSVEQESARDLVRAREDCRGDLMHDRHRLDVTISAFTDTGRPAGLPSGGRDLDWVRARGGDRRLAPVPTARSPLRGDEIEHVRRRHLFDGFVDHAKENPKSL